MNAKFPSVPRVIATYSHCLSSPPVMSGIPNVTVLPCAVCPVIASPRSSPAYPAP